ncbi:hypothetical protein MGYG_06614 [Nannizzia gypsea CBS 118893]|uniref:Tse2 ADP-ribosyltransferase toxin domain-containing protein n=1 Tax=Arthroderma gypseum (strain ATCC MYA-4604 / CBS 118893) TaxID=535722 RepID=E4V2Q8_ARTGP|nr:hypothetical protein MGYG_06614 [Nannizzia gypsea CBS 118893]EFR03620.1 hypothetical protein MGYG_06614 [Nannizzia gypsea CBS 118893]
MSNKFIHSFSLFPKALFRLNYGRVVRLRAHPWPLRPPCAFDLFTHAGKVQPSALEPGAYIFPNGASLRPNTKRQQEVVRRARGSAFHVYAIPAGTQLPDDLILVHEFRDHYSLQARKEMTVEELDLSITQFLESQAVCFKRDEWLRKYPVATETF